MRDVVERGRIDPEPEEYGRSVLGARLDVWLPDGEVELLVMAGIHGEEPEGTVALSRAMRTLGGRPRGVACVLAANPDGISRGTRGNANGVDLNRNFPTSDWRAGEVTHRWTLERESEVLLSTGAAAGSEPEVAGFVALVERLRPKQVVALHGPLSCIDDPEGSALGRWLSKRTAMPLVDGVGYPTPGSFGTWGKENGVGVITYEFPPVSLEAVFHHHVGVLVELLATG